MALLVYSVREGKSSALGLCGHWISGQRRFELALSLGLSGVRLLIARGIAVAAPRYVLSVVRLMSTGYARSTALTCREIISSDQNRGSASKLPPFVLVLTREKVALFSATAGASCRVTLACLRKAHDRAKRVAA